MEIKLYDIRINQGFKDICKPRKLIQCHHIAFNILESLETCMRELICFPKRSKNETSKNNELRDNMLLIADSDCFRIIKAI